MNLSTTEAFSMNKWQRCYFELKSTDATCDKKANALRGILSQIHVAHAAGSISTNGAVQLTRQYSDILSGLVDSQSELNNYAEDILNICSDHRNESQEWESSFTPESLLQLECIQQMVKESEQFKTNQISGSTMNIRNAPPDTRAPIGFIKSSNPDDTTQLTMSHEDHHKAGSNPFKETNYKQSVCQSYANSGPSTQFNPALSVFGSILKPRPTELQNSKNSVDTSRSGFNKDAERNNQQKSFYDTGSRPNITDTDSRNFQLKSRLFGGVQSRMQSGHKRKVDDMNRSETGNFNPSYVSRRQGVDICNEGFNEPQAKPVNNFVTARDQLSINNQKKNNRGKASSNNGSSSTYGTSRKVLGTRRGLNSKFVPPISNKDDGNQGRGVVTGGSSNFQVDEPVDERLKNIDPKMIELVMNEVMDSGPPIHWDDIAGLEFAKETIKEIVVWPMLRPDIFYGLRGPPKGLLLFGPPGTGKTLIGKCIANQSGATFFSISASSLTSKWIGEGEKMVRALFAVSRCHQPAVIFIDEIDSLLSQRSADEHESSRRIKTEFLVQLDGATTNSEDRLLVVGATNRPHEIDEAARRRLVKRLYIPLPDYPARKQIIVNLLSKQSYELDESELSQIQRDTEVLPTVLPTFTLKKASTAVLGYSGADVANLCREAALGPVRCIKDIQQVSADQVRPILFKDFQAALKNVRPSVSQQDLNIYLEWNKQYGSGA